MKSISTKKIIIIFSILIVIVLSFVLIAYATGNSKYPTLSDPNGVFYERLDESGNVIYQITNKELFDEIKLNDGVDQALLMADTYLLKSYLDTLTTEQIANKILELKYGTSDADEIADLDQDTKTKYEDAYNQSIVLAGYEGNEETYAALALAKELYTLFAINNDGEVSDLDVASEFVNNYFEDIQAIKIRFTSSADAKNVMHLNNLLTYNLTTLREYLGFKFVSETITDDDENVVEAYTTVVPYYFDDDNNILNLKDEEVFTIGTSGTYTDKDDNEYALDENGNLLDDDLNVVIDHTLLFDSKETATTYKAANTVYYTVTKNNAFDKNEVTKVYDANDTLVYTINADGKIFDLLDNDVTDTTDLIVNKVYTDIENVTVCTVNNSKELTDNEILAKFVKMYNYVYGEYRDALPENASAEDLIALNDSYLIHNYDTTYAAQTSLAAYMFKTLDLTNEDGHPYSPSPKAYAGTNDDSYYLIFKLDQPDKVDAYGIMFDYIEARIAIPTTVADDITLPTTSLYGSTIKWASSNTALITADGKVVNPSEATDVKLTYTITMNSKTRTGEITVNVLPSGSNSSVTENTAEQVPFKTILNNNDLYDELYNGLINDMVYGTKGSDNVDSHIVALRQKYDFTLYDYYMQLTYQGKDSDYEINKKGSKDILFSLSGRPGDESAAYKVSADDYFDYVMTKNQALYLIYASQEKELVYSSYYVQEFGTQRDIEKNKSDRMQEMYDNVQNTKDYYAYLEKLYASYGISFAYDSFSQYIYSQYSVKTESDLLHYFIQSVLQPYLINEGIENLDLVELLYPSVQDYFNNYFSLNAKHLLIYVDFNEDGVADDFNEYKDSLTQDQKDAFDTLLANFETLIADQDDIEKTVTTYQAALRSDATWGVFKQAGICLMFEDLNQVDEDKKSHSVTYTGEYGIKDTYVPEFTAELVRLYQEYSLDQNSELESMTGTVETQFGYHYILVTKGDDFDKPTAKFAEEDSANPKYSDGSENANDMPTLAQLELYASYFFYSTVYDLSQADIEEQYNITVPDLPKTVSDALEVYFSEQLQNVYVLGTINIVMSEHLLTGNALTTDYSSLTTAELQAELAKVKDIYYQALFADYITEE